MLTGSWLEGERFGPPPLAHAAANNTPALAVSTRVRPKVPMRIVAMYNAVVRFRCGRASAQRIVPLVSSAPQVPRVLDFFSRRAAGFDGCAPTQPATPFDSEISAGGSVGRRRRRQRWRRACDPPPHPRFRRWPPPRPPGACTPCWPAQPSRSLALSAAGVPAQGVGGKAALAAPSRPR